MYKYFLLTIFIAHKTIPTNSQWDQNAFLLHNQSRLVYTMKDSFEKLRKLHVLRYRMASFRLIWLCRVKPQSEDGDLSIFSGKHSLITTKL